MKDLVERENTGINLINKNWMIAGVLLAIIVSASSVATSWPRISPENQASISFVHYYLNVLAVYLSWLGIAVLANWVRVQIPLFSEKYRHWFWWHSGIAGVIALVHLHFDTLLLWWLFSAEFSYWYAYTEKLLRWLPYELLGYWACVGLFTVVDAKQARASVPIKFLRQVAVKEKDEVRLLDVSAIECLEAYDNYVFVFTDEQKHILKDSLNNLESQLDPNLFVRVHRSFMVNLGVVKKRLTEGNGQHVLVLASGRKVPVSRRRKKQLVGRINARMQLAHPPFFNGPDSSHS